MKDAGFRRYLLRGDIREMEGCGKLYVNYVTELPQKKAPFCGKVETEFRPESQNTSSRVAASSMSMEYIPTRYKVKEVIGSCESGSIWSEYRDENVKLFLSLVQLISDKMATSLKSTALVAYYVNTILLKVSATRRQRLLDIVHTKVRFLP